VGVALDNRIDADHLEKNWYKTR